MNRVSAGPRGEMAEGGPHHRLQRENRWLLETQNECGWPCLPGKGAINPVGRKIHLTCSLILLRDAGEKEGP